jgi:hypothetical protein
MTQEHTVVQSNEPKANIKDTHQGAPIEMIKVIDIAK